MKVVSLERKTGKFTPANRNDEVEYDNYVFTVESNLTEGLIFGKKYEQIKVPVRDFEKYYNGPVTGLQGKDVLFERDQNNRLQGVWMLNK